MIRIFVVFFSFATALMLVPAVSGAVVKPDSDLADLQLRSVMQSRTSRQLNLEIDQLDHLASLRKQCEIQLADQRLPIACFGVIKIEIERKLINEQKAAEQKSWLESSCLQRGKKSRDLRELEAAKQSADLPKKCQIEIQSRLDDLKYAAETENPNDLFTGRKKSERSL